MSHIFSGVNERLARNVFIRRRARQTSTVLNTRTCTPHYPTGLMKLFGKLKHKLFGRRRGERRVMKRLKDYARSDRPSDDPSDIIPDENFRPMVKVLHVDLASQYPEFIRPESPCTVGFLTPLPLPSLPSPWLSPLILPSPVIPLDVLVSPPFTPPPLPPLPPLPPPSPPPFHPPCTPPCPLPTPHSDTPTLPPPPPLPPRPSLHIYSSGQSPTQISQLDLVGVSAPSLDDEGPEPSGIQTLDLTASPALPEILDCVSSSLPQPSPAHIMLAVLFDLLFWILGLSFATLARVFEPGTSLAIGQRFRELEFGRESRVEPHLQPQQDIAHLICCRTAGRVPGQF